MTELTIHTSLDGIDWDAVATLFSDVGWGNRNPTEIKQAFSRSSNTRFAYSNGRLVGFGRTIDDGQYYATIVDLVVDPVYQGKGIGRALLSALNDATQDYLFTTLTAAPGKEGFYQKHGWQKMKTGYIMPRTDKQREEYT